jgi:hypothetical protein
MMSLQKLSTKQLPLVSSFITCTTVLIVTVNVHDALLPLSSVAVQVTVVTPIGNVLPDAGVQTTVGVLSQASVTVGGG